MAASHATLERTDRVRSTQVAVPSRVDTWLTVVVLAVLGVLVIALVAGLAVNDGADPAADDPVPPPATAFI